MPTITRSSGDQTAIKIRWPGDPDLTLVTAMRIDVYQDKAKATLIETLAGEKRGFDPATYFPIIDADWVATRYWQITLVRDTIEQPLPDVYNWVQT